MSSHYCGVVVYGWYGRHNVGDELMKQALIELFEPRHVTLKFVDKIDERTIEHEDAVIFGGGSILHDDPHVSPGALVRLLNKEIPTFYVGIGGEVGPSKMHAALLDVAEVVSFRELDTPDLAYSLGNHVDDAPVEEQHTKSLLLIPSVELLPTHQDAHWMHVAWEHYKNEIAQTFDQFIDKGYTLSIMLMCRSEEKDDAWVAAEIVGRMSKRTRRISIFDAPQNITDVVNKIREYSAVITQRYHGIILSEMAGISYVNVVHHDKLKHAHPQRGQQISYHGIQKDVVSNLIENCVLGQKLGSHVVAREVYDNLADKIVGIIKQRCGV